MSEWILVTAGLFLVGLVLGATADTGKGAASRASDPAAGQANRDRLRPAC